MLDLMVPSCRKKRNREGVYRHDTQHTNIDLWIYKQYVQYMGSTVTGEASAHLTAYY